jgi:hypothetical protein
MVFFFAELCSGGASYTDNRAGAQNKWPHSGEKTPFLDWRLFEACEVRRSARRLRAHGHNSPLTDVNRTTISVNDLGASTRAGHDPIARLRLCRRSQYFKAVAPIQQNPAFNGVYGSSGGC